jgi:hypothetical protein
MPTVPRPSGASASAIRAGQRYVRHSPPVRRMLLRVGLFVLPGAALWALLPLVASRLLGTGPTGYGVLLAALGAGAVLGADLLPRLGGERLRTMRIAKLHAACLGGSKRCLGALTIWKGFFLQRRRATVTRHRFVLGFVRYWHMQRRAIFARTTTIGDARYWDWWGL